MTQPSPGDATPLSELLSSAPLRISAVATRLGVASSTLRTWERRYGLQPSVRTSGAHRLYTGDDIVRLVAMVALTRRGVPPCEAAKEAAAASCQELRDKWATSSTAPCDVDQGFVAPVVELAQHVQGPLDGNLDGVEAPVRRLLKRASVLDIDGVRAIVGKTLLRCGTETTWETLIAPALRLVGDHWSQTGRAIDMEHLLTNAITLSLRVHASNQECGSGLVLLASAPKDLHDLPLAALKAALAENGIKAVSLGARLPYAALADAAERAEPDVVVIFSLMPLEDIELADIMALARKHTTVLAGPGWECGLMPQGVHHVASLSDAVCHLCDLADA